MVYDSPRLREIESRLTEIRSLLDSCPDSQLRALEKEINDLGAEKNEIIDDMKEKQERQRRSYVADGITNGTIQVRSLGFMHGDQGGKKTMDFENMPLAELRATAEYRSAFFKSMQGKALTDVEQRAFSTAVNSGGAAIPTVTHEEILQKLKQVVALLPHITVTEMPGNVTIPVEIGEAAAAWVDELLAIPETGDAIGSVKLGGFTLAKLIPVSIAAESMSASAFETYLTNLIVEKMSIAVESAILNGTGVGQPTGILTGIVWTNNINSFTYATTGMTYDDMLKPMSRLGSGYLPNAAWCMSSTTLYDKVAKVTGTDGKSIFVPDAVEGFAGKIMGKPVILDDHLAANMILFGNFRYYFLNFSHPIALEKSRESGFRKATVDYRGVAVVDGKPAMSEAFIKMDQAAV